MKTLDNIISESKRSTAAIQAKQYGLQPDGHGGFYNKNGEFVADSEEDKYGNTYLRFSNQRQKVGRDPDQYRTKNNQKPYATQVEHKVIREKYINKEIYNVGDKIQVVESGVVGEIIRRGTNYLICVTEDKEMFKPWLTDVVEWTDVSGVPANQREVGTDKLRKYVERLTSVEKIKQFLQKYNKKNNLMNR